MNLYASLIAVFFALTVIVIVAMLMSYIVGVVNPPGWMIKLFHLVMFATFIFAVSLVAAPFIRLPRR